jgi:hypothetical protein
MIVISFSTTDFLLNQLMLTYYHQFINTVRGRVSIYIVLECTEQDAYSNNGRASVIPEFSCCRYSGSTLKVRCSAPLFLTLKKETKRLISGDHSSVLFFFMAVYVVVVCFTSHLKAIALRLIDKPCTVRLETALASSSVYVLFGSRNGTYEAAAAQSE